MVSRYIRSNILGFIAIFIALGGMGVAAGLSKNSVKSKHIKNGQVKNADLASDSVTSDKVPADALTGADIDEASLQGLPGGGSPSGPAGGDLSGTYPDPTVGTNAIGSAEVINNSLLGEDIDELSLDSAVLQSRVAGTCPVGSSIRAVAQNGTVTCETDDDTIPPGGAASGDLSGNYPNPTLAANSVDSAEIAAGAVEPAEFGALPAARARPTSNPTIANNSAVALGLGTGVFDIGNLHDPVTNNTRLTAPIDGIYTISGQAAFGANATGIRAAQITRNGTNDILVDAQVSAANSASLATDLPLTTIVELNAGDFVELRAFQNSGGDLGLFASRTHLAMAWIAPGP